jgi:hypothetical protein
MKQVYLALAALTVLLGGAFTAQAANIACGGHVNHQAGYADAFHGLSGVTISFNTSGHSSDRLYAVGVGVTMDGYTSNATVMGIGDKTVTQRATVGAPYIHSSTTGHNSSGEYITK